MSKNSTKRTTRQRAEKNITIPPADEVRSPAPSTLEPGTFARELHRSKRGTGAGSAGQSGDLQGLPSHPDADSESVQELAAEGQALEAHVVNAMEQAKDADQGEVRTHEVPADDVPREYLDKE